MPNRVRFDGTARRFYEVWYFIFNDSVTGDGYWIRYTLLNPLDDDPAAGGTLWFAFTDRDDGGRGVAVKSRFPRESLNVAPGEFRVRIGGASLEDGRLAGGFSADGHEIAWDLAYEPGGEPHFYFGESLRRLTEARSSVTVPNPRIELRGTVTIDGRRAEIARAIGHQAHHWGVEQSPRWIWAHCCDFEEDDRAVLELLSARGPAGVTATFVNLYTKDRAVLCSGPRSLLRNRATSGLGYWRFEGTASEGRIVAEIRVDPADVRGFVYTATDYRRSECWNTQVGDCLVRVYEPSGALVRVLRARGRAAAEIHDSDVARIPYRLWPDATRSAIG
ncbi:MAG: hypothetical protein ACREQJ_01975 [Candidatus Binatia bacterium]